jgi:transposase
MFEQMSPDLHSPVLPGDASGAAGWRSSLWASRFGARRLAPTPSNQKSDGRDALELCEGLRRKIYRAIDHVPGEEVSRLRDTLSRRRHFVRLQAAQIGAVKALLRAAGLGRLSRSLGSEAGWSRVIAVLAQHQELRTYAEQHLAVWRCAREQIAVLEASLARQQKESFAAQTRRLQTIPGVGPIVASTAIAVLSSPERFADAKHAASYAGLVPSTYQSGDRQAHGRITKRGSAELRAMLLKRRIIPVGPITRSTPTSHGCARDEATRWRSPPWPTDCVGSSSRCCVTTATSTLTSSVSNVDGSSARSFAPTG